jgi:D-alanine-D-alanine ligase
MKRRRILVLMHEDLVPPDRPIRASGSTAFQTEADVIAGLEHAGHDVTRIGVRYDLSPLSAALGEVRPHIVFNLLEEFQDRPSQDHAVVSYLDLLGVRYTGCGARGMVLARDKALSKQILSHGPLREALGIELPRFSVFRRGQRVRRPSWLPLPAIVKVLDEEGSVGIAKASLVHTGEKLEERVAFVHEGLGADAIVEEFIDGRELYASVIGNGSVRVFPTRELVMERSNGPLINTGKAKWDDRYRERHGIGHVEADLPKAVELRVRRIARRIYGALDLTGYARIDLRMATDGRIFFLEANPNPDIASKEEFARSALSAGVDYPRLLEKIVSLGLSKRR